MRGIAVLVLLGCATAQADGIMVVKIGESVSSPKQEALLRVHGDRVTVTLRTHFRRGPTEVGWIIPVPTEPEEVGAGDGALLDALDDATAPEFYVVGSKGGGCSCAAGSVEGTRLDVEATASGTAGIYDWVALRAGDARHLETWLRENGFAAPAGAADTFDRYVAASGRFRADNWANVEIPGRRVVLDRKSPSRTNYEALLRQGIDAAGGRAFVTEYAGQAVLADPVLDAARLFVTRLRTIVSRDAMDRDVEIQPDDIDDEVSREFHLGPPRRASSTGEATLLIVALALLRRGLSTLAR